MLNVVFARIDNRLLHGIVMTQYLPNTSAKRIMVVDDATANDQMRKDMMNLAKPSGFASSIITLETAKTNILNNKYKEQPIFFLTKSPITVLELAKIGVKFPTLIMGCTDNLDNPVKLSARCTITEEELEACRQLRDMGTVITVQHSPQHAAQDMWKIVK